MKPTIVCDKDCCAALLYALIPDNPRLPHVHAYSEPGTWVTGHGQRIPIVELENGHLKNIIRWLSDYTRIHGAGPIDEIRWQAALMLVQSGRKDIDPMHIVTDAPMHKVWQVLFPALPGVVAEARKREFDIPDNLLFDATG